MSMRDEDITICLEVMHEVEEIHYEMRKDVEQTYYVGEVKQDDTYGDNMIEVPDYLVGFYRMNYAADLKYTNFRDAMKQHGFSKCKKVETITYEYEFIN